MGYSREKADGMSLPFAKNRERRPQFAQPTKNRTTEKCCLASNSHVCAADSDVVKPLNGETYTANWWKMAQ